MSTITTPRPATLTVWQVTELILAQLRDDAYLNPHYLNKSLYMDWWMEQPFFEREEYAIPEKAIYIDSNVMDSVSEGNGRMRLTVQWTIYFEWRSNGDSHVGSETKAHFMGFAPYCVAIHRALQEWLPTGAYSALKRVAGPNNEPGLQRMGALISQTYQCIIYDGTATPELVQAHLDNFKISAEVVSTEE